MKIVGGILTFLLIVGVGFIVLQLFGKGGTVATGGDWLTKNAQSSTWAGPERGFIGAEPTAQERAELAFTGSQGRSGRSHF